MWLEEHRTKNQALNSDGSIAEASLDDEILHARDEKWSEKEVDK